MFKVFVNQTAGTSLSEAVAAVIKERFNFERGYITEKPDCATKVYFVARGFRNEHNLSDRLFLYSGTVEKPRGTRIAISIQGETMGRGVVDCPSELVSLLEAETYHPGHDENATERRRAQRGAIEVALDMLVHGDRTAL